MRTEFEQQLKDLNQNLTDMSELCIQAVEEALKALIEQEEAPAHQVLEREMKINDLEREISQEAIRLVMRQQPVASDLRFLSASISMNTDLERIGDQAEDISRLVLQMIQTGYEKRELGSLVEMSRRTNEMIEQSVQAFISDDAELAEQVVDSDDVVDALFVKVRDEIVRDIQEGSYEASTLTDMLMIAKYLERIGDHATNIGEAVYFSITGQKIEAK